jgi:hypothetical protein
MNMYELYLFELIQIYAFINKLQYISHHCINKTLHSSLFVTRYAFQIVSLYREYICVTRSVEFQLVCLRMKVVKLYIT